MTPKEIKALVAKLSEAADAYYNSDSPIISDQEFDTLVDKLRLESPGNPFLNTIGAPPLQGTLVKHSIPMGSQDKLQDYDKFHAWAVNIKAKSTDPKAFVVQYKLDGSSVALNYEKGVLINALTRGDGLIGEDITANVLKMQNVKKVLPAPFTGSIRGEIMLGIKEFNTIFAPLGYSNPRNTTSGLSRDRKPGDLQKYLKIIYYDVCTTDESFPLETNRLVFIDDVLTLETVTTYVCNTPEEVWKRFKALEVERDSLNFEIDGIVIRANEIKVQEELGTSSDMRPKGQKCVKFPARAVITECIDIPCEVGHTGAIIPTAVLKPVDVGGVTVTHTTLCNFEEIERLGLAPGDKVRITRRGDVIPKLEEKVQDGPNHTRFIPPTKCPSCSSVLVKDGAHLFCRNDDCDGRCLKRMITYATKRDIKYLGDELLTELYKVHNIKAPHQLYTLTEESLSQVKRGIGIVGTASKLIISEINKSRKATLPDFLGSLGIPFLGRRQVEVIMEQGVMTIEQFMGLKESHLTNMKGFSEDGSKAAKIIAGREKAYSEIIKLLTFITIIEPEAPKPLPTEGKLKGLSFCFTGKIERLDASGNRYTRTMMHDAVTVNGGLAVDEVKPGLTYLVQADPSSQSSKTKKAQKTGTKIISETDFWKMI